MGEGRDRRTPGSRAKVRPVTARRERVLAQLDPIRRTLDKIDERVALQAQMKETERKYAADAQTRQEAPIQS